MSPAFIPDDSSGVLHPEAGWFFILAHPGHELRLHHFVERVAPTVAVLTDGSGSTGVSRADDTRALLRPAGAHAATVFAPLADREAYRTLMTSDAQPFLDLIDPLADAIGRGGARHVVVDAEEGFNPVHDVCHWLGRTIVSRARLEGRTIDLFELDLVAHPDGSGDGLRLVLDEAAFERKLFAARRYTALAAEAAAAFDRYGCDAFRTEFVRRLDDRPPREASWKPHYEEVGEERVKSGRYPSVLRYGAHVRPMIEVLIGRAETPRAGLIEH